MIHIVFCIHDEDGSYIQHTAVTMTSVFCHTSAAVTVHLVHDDTLTEENRDKLTQLTNQYNQKIEYYHIEQSDFEEAVLKLKYASLKGSFSLGTLYRLKIAEILPIDKVLYLDSDIVVNIDIQSLWNIDLDQYYIAAVRDLKATRRKITNKIHFKKMGFSADQYFNAGVILFNLKILREEMALFNDAISFLLKHSTDAIFFDQDALNALLQKKTLLLPAMYNFIPVSLQPQKVSDNLPAIIHFAGPKPWKYKCSQFDWMYWKYFTKTSWGNTLEKLLMAQKDVTIDLGYAFYMGEIGSRRMFLDGFFFRAKKILGQCF